MATTTKMTENSKNILNFFKNAGVGIKFSTTDIMTQLGLTTVGSVTGVTNSLFKKGLIDKEKAEVSGVDKEGKEIKKQGTVYWLTEEGAAFNPDAE